MIIYKIIKSPLGDMVLGSIADKICFLEFYLPERYKEMSGKIRKVFDAEWVEGTNDVIEQAEKELQEYFSGKRKNFTVPLDLRGSEFEIKIWEQLQKIPYGHVCSYGDIAKKINNPKSVRAVGGANHNNPVAIIVPCHRVIGKNGSLVGYGGGIDKKKLLIELERGELNLL
ncbi:methylated-DNA--[protein]-cysteine S-methyltransferase [bacterium]|nr:MAG: methylated-DNA--[protein]-cysteine S-methyltransferase [bacterium]